MTASAASSRPARSTKRTGNASSSARSSSPCGPRGARDDRHRSPRCGPRPPLLATVFVEVESRRFEDILSIQRWFCAPGGGARGGNRHHGGGVAGRDRLEADGAPSEGHLGGSRRARRRGRPRRSPRPQSPARWSGEGEVKLAVVPVAALVAVVFARVPVAGFVLCCGASARPIDLIALPEVGVSSLQFEPAEVLLWLAIVSLVFLPTAARRELSSLALRRESLVMALFLARSSPASSWGSRTAPACTTPRSRCGSCCSTPRSGWRWWR